MVGAVGTGGAAQPAIENMINPACKMRAGLNIINPYGDTINYSSVVSFA